MNTILKKFIKENKQETNSLNGWYIITPEFAEELLRHNTDNARNKNAGKIAQYASDMKAKEWKKNGESIVFNTKDILQDGQNRLSAIIQANTPVCAYIIFDAEETKRYDYGAARSQKDENKDVSTLGHQIAKTILRYTENVSCVPSGIHQRFVKEKTDLLNKASDIITGGKTGFKEGAKSACGAIVAAFLETNEISEDEMRMFFHVVNTGNVIGCAKDPSSALVFLRQLKELKGGGRANQKIQLETVYQALLDFKANKQRKIGYKSNCDTAEEFLCSTFGNTEEIQAA